MIKKVCIILPAYNEEKVILDVIKGIEDVVKLKDYSFDTVVVNDCSTDGTNRKVANHAIVINHILNQGAGGATSTGLRYAYLKGYDIAITMDADGQHDPSDVVHCIKKAEESNVDLLIGSRLIDTSGMSKVKVIGNIGLTLITWVLFGVKVTDSQSGLRVFSSKALSTLEWKSTGYDFCSEMIWRAKQSKLIIAEHPIKAIYTEYSLSKGQNNWNAVTIVRSLVRRRLVELFE